MANPEHLEILKQGVEKWNEWREDNPNIKKIDLSRAYLSDTNLRKAHFTGADLSDAYLGDADLSLANLREADLSKTYLRGATLRDANLILANMNRTELDFADLNGAVLGHTTFINLRLSNVVGLETCQHHRKSTLGLDTIYKSQGKIPEIFLRGCGVPENFIPFIKSLVNTPIEFYSCFISYSHDDKSFARRLHDQLQMKGIAVGLMNTRYCPVTIFTKK